MVIYAVCPDCGHIEPRPEHALDCWDSCESCGEESPQPHEDIEDAECASEAALHAAELRKIPDSSVPYGARFM